MSCSFSGLQVRRISRERQVASRAVRLSTRYISGRQLPDKAIDLVDEAASRLKMQIDSLPEPIDQLERRLTSLAIEEQALSRYTIDLTQWHTVQVTRLNHVFSVAFDGTVMWTYNGSSSTLPDTLKHVVLQQECLGSGCPSG